MEFDLSTNLGTLKLKSPVIVGSCPMTAIDLQRIALVSNGAGAIVLPSLLEEQTVRSDQVFADSHTDVDSYLRMVESAKANCRIPVIASLSGNCSKVWGPIASRIQSAGADAIELSVRQPSPGRFHGSAAIEDAIVACAKSIDDAVTLPFFAKLTQSYTSVSHLANRLESSVDGLTLFGRATAIDIELDSLKLTSKWGLTESGSIVRSLESIMRVRTQCPTLSITASGGIWTSTDLIKALMAGANAVMVTSVIYRDGASVIGTLIEGLVHYMELHDTNSVEDLAALAPPLRNGQIPSQVEAEAFSPFPERASSTATPVEGDRFGHPKSSN